MKQNQRQAKNSEFPLEPTARRSRTNLSVGLRGWAVHRPSTDFTQHLPLLPSTELPQRSRRIVPLRQLRSIQSKSNQFIFPIMARGNQRDKAREKAQKAAAGQVGLSPFPHTVALEVCELTVRRNTRPPAQEPSRRRQRKMLLLLCGRSRLLVSSHVHWALVGQRLMIIVADAKKTGGGEQKK